ncbi:deoxyribonuclease-1-like isoform X2 [Alosa sapidissima]|uniref:deoxyribonuclease-1-like isoform X2 n=1 Tax=Alosa sapidissima TaxID=34773 RepID=UPI001C0854F5|nr:deoxyribonuclease-1-like isoform X2 [Alosa sapidissima]
MSVTTITPSFVCFHLISLTALQTSVPSSLKAMKIASFNVQRFGVKKVSDPEVLSTLVRIVSRYDIILILEVTDVSGDSVEIFLKELNRVNTEHHYTLKLSTRLGRTRYKEQFLFLFRDDLVDLVGSYQYEDSQEGDHDAFAREPYILRFTSHHTVLKDLVLMPVHTKPDDSLKELDELYEVFLAVRRKWKTDNVMILGDFNADGSYVSERDFHNIRIRSDKNFHWLIGDDVDTTANTGNTHTYDRIVVYGQDMLESVVPGSARSFNFHTAFNLTEDMALRVSDHYPVEVVLRCEKSCPGHTGWNVFPRSQVPGHDALQPRGFGGSQEPIPESELPPLEPLPQGPMSMSNQPSRGSVFGGNQSPYPSIRSDLRPGPQPYSPAIQDGNMPYGPSTGGNQPGIITPRHGVYEVLPFQGAPVVIFPPVVEHLMVEVLGLQRDNLHLEREKLGLEIQMLRRNLARADRE